MWVRINVFSFSSNFVLLDFSFTLYLYFCYRTQLCRLQQQQILNFEILTHQSHNYIYSISSTSSNVTTSQRTPIPAWNLILILVCCCSLPISTPYNKSAESDIFQLYMEKTIKQSKRKKQLHANWCTYWQSAEKKSAAGRLISNSLEEWCFQY